MRLIPSGTRIQVHTDRYLGFGGPYIFTTKNTKLGSWYFNKDGKVIFQKNPAYQYPPMDPNICIYPEGYTCPLG